VHSFPGPQKVAGSWTLSAVEALAAAVAQAAPSGAPRYAELARWPLAGPAGEPAA
jgi:hypothetical protein